MPNRIRKAILNGNRRTLNVYFTAGYPNLDSTVEIILALSANGVDLIELGMPYSDPLADGLTIQQSSEKALKNGLNLKILFEQIEEARKFTDVPIILMGYFNQLLQFGVEKFLAKAAELSVDGLIIPDLPMQIYEKSYRSLFEQYQISISFLVTPMTSDLRIKQADRLSTGFIYLVSQSSITGKKGSISDDQRNYFERVRAMNLNNPLLVGFGIHDSESFEKACEFSDGAIIGSAYIRALGENDSIAITTKRFISGIKIKN